MKPNLDLCSQCQMCDQIAGASHEPKGPCGFIWLYECQVLGGEIVGAQYPNGVRKIEDIEIPHDCEMYLEHKMLAEKEEDNRKE